MIQASHPSTLWFPGKKLEGFGAATLSARAQEIAKSREELLGLLQDLPESEFELSFTDLVEKSDSGTDNDAAPKDDKDSPPENNANKASIVVAAKQRKKLKRTNSSGASRSSSSNGVLLNMYLPSSLSRSLTTSRASRGTTASPNLAVHREKREKEHVMLGCLSGLWETRQEKSKKKAAEKKRRDSQDHHCF